MAETKVNITLKPDEYRLLRDELSVSVARLKQRIEEWRLLRGDISPEERNQELPKARARLIKLEDLLERL